MTVVMTAPFALADTTISRVLPTSGAGNTGTQSGRTAGATNVSRAAVMPSVVRTANVVPDASPRESGDTKTESGTVRSVVNRDASSGTSVSDTSVVRVGSRVLNMGDDAPGTTSRGSGNTRTAPVSRSVSATKTNSARENLEATVNTVGRNARVESASINSNPVVRRAGVTLRPTTAEVGGRATIAGTDIQTGSNIATEARAVQSRATTNAGTETTAESIAAAKATLEQTAELNASCQQQYNDCMDQFCAVIDSNQGRCSCSANLSNYAEVEEAVTDANTQLNEVAQQIRYVGLSADEIRAIMNATEAEEALAGARDNTANRNMLEEIEELIMDPTGGTSYTASSGYTGLDMNIDFSSDMSDLFSLDFLNMGTTSLSNLRGTALYNAAKSRCKTVLNQCKEAGANIDQISGNYDLAIDKDCIAYEQGLEKMNETLKSNVRSANLMLQKARLAVVQNKNQYDIRGCIGALETCMTDDMVCGSDYEKCLDPSKKYIDENGEVVLGQDISTILTNMSTYDNSAINADFIKNAVTGSADDAADTNGSSVVKYLMQKIGMGEEVTDGGLCRPVLDKCQMYTYTDSDDGNKYNQYNDVVVNYIQRALVNIRAAQQQIISDYASECMVDVANCYNQQVTQVNAWSSNADIGSIYNVMRGACYNVALTCAYAVFANDKTNSCSTADTCITNISQMFYQSLLCPDDKTFDVVSKTCK